MLCVAGICVAGYSSEKNEILELVLPLKLYAGSKQVNPLGMTPHTLVVLSPSHGISVFILL